MTRGVSCNGVDGFLLLAPGDRSVTTQDSLSVVLPVHNGANRLAQRIGVLLEILPEITVCFEVLILDNGSSDQSEEVSYDLARSFPQLRVARHSKRRSEQEVMQTGLQQTCGDLVVIYDERSPICEHELRRMWELRHDQQLVIARPPGEPQNLLIERLATWAARIQEECVEQAAPNGIQMIRRRAIKELSREPIEMKKPAIASSRRSRLALTNKA